MLDLTLASPRWLLGRLLLARYSLHGHSELSLDVQRIATLAQIAHLFHRTKDSEHFSAYRNLWPPSLENFVTIASLIAGLLDRLPQHLKAFSSFFLVGTRSVVSAAETYLLGLFASPISNMLSMSAQVDGRSRGGTVLEKVALYL
jgi:hypothetical protein